MTIKNWPYCCAMFALLCTFLAASINAHAQVFEDTAGIKSVGTVEIYRNRPTTQLESAVPMQQIRRNEIQRLNSLSVADAMRYFTGIQLKDYGGVGGLKTINVRSLGTNHTHVFYNGLLISNAQNGQVDLGKYSLSNLEEIILFSGQNTDELLPAKAFSSASGLFLKTKLPNFSVNRPLNQSYEIKFGDFGLINPRAAVELKISPKLIASLNTEFTNAHGKYKYRYTNGVYDTTVVRQNGDITFNRIEATVFHQLKNNQKLQYQAYHYASQRGLPGAIVSNKYEFSQRLWDRAFFAQTQYENRDSEFYNFNLQAKYSSDYSRYIDPDYKLINGFLDNRYQQNAYYLSSAHSLKLGPRDLFKLSMDYSFDKLDANLYNFVFPERNQLLIAISHAYKSKELRIDAGLLATYVRDKVKTGHAAGEKSVYTPSFSINFIPFEKENLSLRGFYKSSFRLPTFNDLYYTFLGNNKLSPEYAKQFNLGFTAIQPIKLEKATLQLDADIYFNKVSDKIVAIPTLNLFRWTMVNLDDVEIRGLNIGIRASKKWQNLSAQAKLNYTYELALDKTINGTAYNHQIPYIPEHSGSARLQLDYKNWGLNYGFVFTGSRYSQKANIPENFVPAWYTHDLSIQKSILLSNYQFKIGVEVNNLLNQYYDVILNYPMPGRNYRASIQMNF